jgi:hypothetical protein
VLSRPSADSFAVGRRLKVRVYFTLPMRDINLGCREGKAAAFSVICTIFEKPEFIIQARGYS